MAKKLKIRKIWSYKHVRKIDSCSLARESGDVLVTDRRESIALLDRTGKTLWSKNVSFSPLEGKISCDGAYVFILTFKGQVIKVSRGAELEWESFVDKDARTMAVKSRGQSVAVASYKGRFHGLNSSGERTGIVHTAQPVIHARFTSKSGSLFVASAHGWVGLYDKEFKPVGEYDTGRTINEIEVSERGGKIFLPSRDEGLTIIEFKTSQMSVYNPGFAVAKVGIDRKGNLMVAVGGKGEIAVMDINGDILWNTDTDHSFIFCEMTIEGDRFVAVSDKGVVECYELLQEEELAKKESFEFLETGEEKKGEKKTSDHFDYLEI